MWWLFNFTRSSTVHVRLLLSNQKKRELGDLNSTPKLINALAFCYWAGSYKARNLPLARSLSLSIDVAIAQNLLCTPLQSIIKYLHQFISSNFTSNNDDIFVSSIFPFFVGEYIAHECRCPYWILSIVYIKTHIYLRFFLLTQQTNTQTDLLGMCLSLTFVRFSFSYGSMITNKTELKND